MAVTDWNRYLKNIRRKLDISQRELGNIVGVSLDTVKKWECRGEPPNYFYGNLLQELNKAIKDEKKRHDLLELSQDSGKITAYGMYILLKIIFGKK